MKRRTFVLSLFVFLFLGYLIGLGGAPIFFSISKSDVKSNEVHVFLEAYATNPALTQMVEFSQLPVKTQKLIAWHRFPNRKNVLDLSYYNTTEVDFPTKEGMWRHTTLKMLAAVQKVVKEKPEAVFVLHVNFSKIPVVLKPFLNALPKNKIKRIHLYEDGYGALFKNSDNFFKNKEFYVPDLIEKTKKALEDDTIKWKEWHTFALRHIYPVTYHFWGGSEIKNIPGGREFFKTIQDADIRSVDFDLFRRILSPQQKQVVYQLSGFDYQKYKSLMESKKSFFFVMGYHFNNQRRKDAERFLLALLKSKQSPYLKNPEEFVWFYKPHPSYDAVVSREEMKKLFPDVLEVPAQVPFEIFILAGLKPTLTAGFSSSLFYGLNSEDVLIYIRRAGDKYVPYLLESGRLKPKQVMNLSEFINLSK